MALNSSGAISLGGSTTGQSVALELGQSATAAISLNDTAVRTLAGVSSGAISLYNFYSKSNTVVGSQSYTTAGTYTWVAPSGVTSVSVVAVGAGGPSFVFGFGANRDRSGGNGGGLAYRNNITVSPGTGYNVQVADIAYGSNQTYTYFNGTPSASSGNVCCGPGRMFDGAGGGTGGYSGHCTAGGSFGGGGGAGGYSGNGGNGGGGYLCCGCFVCTPTTGGAGGAGGGGTRGQGGGGVGLFGQGTSGSAGGYGGSGGANSSGGVGGAYGGGGRGSAGLRIVWPGTTRQFPSTDVGSP